MSCSSVKPNKCSSEQGAPAQIQVSTMPQSTSAATVLDPWAGFYKKSWETRQQQIHNVFPQAPKKEELGNTAADHMVENCIGLFSAMLL